MLRPVRAIIIACVLIVFALVHPPYVYSSPEQDAANVLVLNSYHPAFPWTKSIIEGITSRLGEKGPTAEITLEYLDTKRHKPEDMFPLLKDLFQKKYSAEAFDVIITTDNNALDFLFQYRPVLFPDTPVVFSAINNFDPAMLEGKSAVTGVAEDYDIGGTIELALNLHPGTRRIAVISDTTPTDKINRFRLEQLKPGFINSEHIQFIDLIGVPAPDMQKALRELPEESVILFFNYYRDTEGNVYTLKEGMSLVKENCDLPIYSMWEDKIDEGALGGVITSGELQGESAAEMAIQIISGVPAKDIPVLTESPSVPMFDFEMLKQYGIKHSALPEDSIVLHQPDTFFYRYTSIIWEALLIFAVLMTIIIFLWLNIRRRKKAEKELLSALREKDFLLQELNHRVKNNLAIISSLIGLKNSALGNTVDLTDIKGQIDAIQIVHEILYKSNEVRSIEIHNYFRELLSTVFSSFSSVPVEIVNNTENRKLPTKTAISLGLIVNELATNAIKYGFTGNEKARFTVEMSVDDSADEYILSVSNSGGPFPEGIDLDNPETLGLRLVSALTAQLEGTIELQREPHPIFTIRFPAE